ncbi:MAG: response regulator [Candidatus Rokuibacteriota bacterium]
MAVDQRPDVVFLHIGLPGFDGFEVARRMRQHPQLASVTLVAMTGYGQESDRQHAKQAGFDHHLLKPAAFDDVLRIVASVSRDAS